MRTFLGVIIMALTVSATAADFMVDLKTILEHDDGKFLWFHPRAAAIPDSGGHVVMTLQQHLQQSDYYSGLYVMHSRDGGATWTDPDPQPELAWQAESETVTIAVCDVTPGWHAPTKKLLAIGVKVRYENGKQLLEKPQSHAAAYAIYDPDADTWTKWQYIAMPEAAGKFFLVTPGCVQWLTEANGDVLIPFYFRGPEDAPYTATVMRCTFDGEKFTYKEHGTELALDVERGFVEPSLIKHGGHYYLTLRNDVKAYVATSEDGLHYGAPQAWTFDDGEDLGSYNTQAHWLQHGDALYLVYTRRGANNDHVMRNRAPLFMAQVNPETLQVLRATERVLVPERGATLGNFGANPISTSESWVTVSEGLWNDAMRTRGATGETYIARILWNEELQK